MIIGISGKIGSGKDTIGKIIQYLTYTKNNRMSFDSFCLLQERWYNHNDWQIKKYAGKLKQVVSILTGISIEDLEKEEVKNKSLGSDWIRYAYANGFTKDNKGNTTMLSKDCDKQRYEIEYRTNWQTAYKTEYTVRMLLQRIGTEAMRNQIHPNVWVNALFADYKRPDNHKYYPEGVGEYPNWIITDVRFPNEFDAIKDRYGYIIRVNRPTIYATPKDNSEFNNQELSKFNHPSETALDNRQDFDAVINNDGSIEDLIETVRNVLDSFNIR